MQDSGNGEAHDEAGGVGERLQPLGGRQQQAQGNPDSAQGVPRGVRGHQAKQHQVRQISLVNRE